MVSDPVTSDLWIGCVASQGRRCCGRMDWTRGWVSSIAPVGQPASYYARILSRLASHRTRKLTPALLCSLDEGLSNDISAVSTAHFCGAMQGPNARIKG